MTTPDARGPIPATPRIEARGGGLYLAVRGVAVGEELWWRVYLCTWDPNRRRHVPARVIAATHLVFVPATGARRVYMLEWPERMPDRDYAFLRDATLLEDRLRRSAFLPTAIFNPRDISPGHR